MRLVYVEKKTVAEYGAQDKSKEEENDLNNCEVPG